MNPRLYPLSLFLGLLLAPVIGSLHSAFAADGSALTTPPEGKPRPCLVPPVPLKKGWPPSLGEVTSPPLPFSPRPPEGHGKPRLRLEGETVTRVLALRVDFSDQEMDSTAAYFERLLLFLRQYYGRVSDGQLRLEMTLSPAVYRLPETMAWYGLDDSIGVRQAILGYDAVRTADPDLDYSLFDQVVLFHAGPGQESDVRDDSRDQIWSVFFRDVDFGYWLPRPGAGRGIETADRTAEGDTVYVPSIAMYPETETQDGFVFSPVGVVCHEFGHALGLPDLYDTVAPGDDVFAESQGIGSWELMASGTWNANGFVPAEFSAWSKVFLGWIDPVVVSAGADVALQAVAMDRRRGVVKVPIGGDEYFLVENRLQDLNGDARFNYTETDSAACFFAPEGDDSVLTCQFDFYADSYEDAEWDYWLPGEGTGSGLLIWHIDESIINDNILYNTVNADPLHKGIDLEEADGIQDMDSFAGDRDAFGSPHDTWRAGRNDRFGPDTVPGSEAYFGILSGITIDRISAPGPVMTFRVAFDRGREEWPVLTPGPIEANHVAIGDLDFDSGQEIAVADRHGNLFILNADGTPAWTGGSGKSFASLGVPVGPPLLADVDGDDRTDLLVMADDGWVYGFRWGAGAPLGAPDGRLVRASRPRAGTRLWAFDLPGIAGTEFGFGNDVVPPPEGQEALSRVEMFSVSSTGRAVSRGMASLHGGSGELPPVIVDVDRNGDLEMIASVRAGTEESPTGLVQMLLLDFIPGQGFLGGSFANAPLPDTAYYSAPVAGDLNRDGRIDAVVTGSNGWIYALDLSVTDGLPSMAILPGWPRHIFASGDDAVSLADVDGNGYLEVLALETGGVLHVFNYHGESLVSLPEQLVSEVKYFVEPQLAPLVVDLSSDGSPEMVLPLSDGQVVAVGARGERLAMPGLLGGGAHGCSPAVEDLDGDGLIEVAVAADHFGGGRIDVRTLGRAAGPPVWGMVRRGGAHDGLAMANERPVVNGPFLSDVFVMPNPARERARFHYRVGAGVEEVAVDVTDLVGRGVRTLAGTAFAGTDNTIEWDLRDAGGNIVAPGVYIGRVKARGTSRSGSESVKIAVLR